MVLKDYMRSVYELELNKYEQERMLQMLNRRLENAKNPELIANQKASTVSEKIWTFIFLLLMLILSPLAGLIVGFILKVAVLIFINFPALILGLFFDNKVIEFFKHLGSSDAIIWFGIIAVSVIALLFFVICIWAAVTEKKDIINFNKSANEKNRRARELSELKVKHINGLITRQKSILAQTNSVLKSYYNTGVLHKDYWGLVPVGTIYSYLDKGLCTQLEGHEGAYLLYENELKWNKVFNKLDDIICRLDEIQSNQLMIARAIKKSNDKIDGLQKSLNSQLDQMNGNLERISANQQISNYFGAVSAINTSYLVKLQNDR